MAPHAEEGDGRQHAHKASAVFGEDFGGYQKMLEADYLEHTLLFGKVKDYLEQQHKPLRILDLGCGDAVNLSKLLNKIPGAVASYTGVDMSDTAIQTAEQMMQNALGKTFPVFFHLLEMLTFLRQTRAAYDVVLASFALHHLPSEEKKEALREIRRLLKPAAGSFVMVDPFRREEETLEAYGQRATEVGLSWTFMGKERQDTFIKHMQDYDIVERKSFFEGVSEELGFKKFDVLCTGAKGLQSSVAVFHA